MASEKRVVSKRARGLTPVGLDGRVPDITAALGAALETAAAHATEGKFFPHGITSVSLTINLPGGVSASLTLTGPNSDGGNVLRAMEDRSAMELIAPPLAPPPGPNDPKPPAALGDRLASKSVTKSIAGAAALFSTSCVGGDSFTNNCAHYLSDAFIRAGYSELNPPCDCINARCGTSAKRPIRARDMWCWFDHMATERRSTLPKNEGLWAVFQLDEAQYWGGHVVIIDTDTGTYYGTGNYPAWSQHCYKW